MKEGKERLKRKGHSIL